MLRRGTFLLGLFLPLTVFAIDFTDVSSRYADAPFAKPDAAAISLLTRIGAVEGNPNGTFTPKSRLNRAEFVKIAWGSKPGSIDRWIDARRKTRCFPDVPGDAWFSLYICAAKQASIVKGFADGKFHPERYVTYAEALKILSKLFAYPTAAEGSSPRWYDPYVSAAQERGVLLPTSTRYDEFLTRGEMARLAAAFVAESQGELASYRLLEQGKSLSSSPSSASSAPSTSSVSSVSSPSSLSSSSSSWPDFPARSHFLLVGQRSQPIAGSTFSSSQEALKVRGAKVKLKTKILSLNALILIDSAGKDVGTLTLDLGDSDEKTWKGFFPSSGAYVIPKATERMLGVVARLKPRGGGGASEELVQVDTFHVTFEGVDSSSSIEYPATTQVFPQHQTAQARVTGVTSVLPAQGVLTAGNSQVLAAFAFSGNAVSGAKLRISGLEVQISKTPSVAVTGWQVGAAEGGTRVDCTVSTLVLSCTNLPEDIGEVGSSPRILRIFGNVTVDQGARDPSLQLSLSQPGAIGVGGAVRWYDGSATFTWTELGSPMAVGTLWK